MAKWLKYGMTEKEFKKLKRVDLLEILVEQEKEIETLRAEVTSLNKKLNDRTICIEKAGSIAEASLQLNGVFEAAYAASIQYIENIQKLSERQEAICMEMERECQERCEKLEHETAEKCQKMMEEIKVQGEKEQNE